MVLRLSEGLGHAVCPERTLDEKGEYSSVQCFVEDGGGPPEGGAQEQPSNRHELLGRQCPGGERRWKRRGIRLRQVRSVELNASEPLMTCRDDLNGVETGEECGPRDEVGAPIDGPA